MIIINPHGGHGSSCIKNGSCTAIIVSCVVSVVVAGGGNVGRCHGGMHSMTVCIVLIFLSLLGKSYLVSLTVL
jgi:hypothetical protein